jgi:hypothetical protein
MQASPAYNHITTVTKNAAFAELKHFLCGDSPVGDRFPDMDNSNKSASGGVD